VNGDHITIRELAAARGVSYDAAKQHIRRCGYGTVPDPADRRSVWIPLIELSEEDRDRVQIHRALPSRQDEPVTTVPAQGNLFAVAFQGEGDGVSVAVPEGRMERAFDLARLTRCLDGDYKRYEGRQLGGRTIWGRADFVAAMAAEAGVGVRRFKSVLKLRKKILSDPRIPDSKKDEVFFSDPAFQALVNPKKRPGLSNHAWWCTKDRDTVWVAERVIELYANQARRSIRQARQNLILEINAKEIAWGGKKRYLRPSEKMIRTLLRRRLPGPQGILARLGEKAFNDKCAPYISRDPESLRSNDVWVTDQKQVDVRLRGAGERLGRIWIVSFMEARSWKVPGYWFGPVLSSDMVMSAAAVAIGRYGVPKAILMDLGKEFACTAFSGSFRKIKGETLLREAQGLCQRLGIDVIKAIGRNPQTKPIERWHRECARFDHNIPGWCGGNTGERPEVLAEFERQHEDWKQGRRDCSPLWTIHQYIHAFISWIENDWNAGHRGRGKYLRGMTPNECWNTHLPAEGIRRVSPAELELATADHRVLKVSRGGQINLTIYGQTLEYQAPELFLRQGDELEVIVSRRSLTKITVLDSAKNGRFLCEAQAKPLFHWGVKAPEEREELRQMIRANRAARKAIYLGNAARRVLEAAPRPVEIEQLQRPIREISSTEFRSRKMKALRAPKRLTAGELARRALEMQGE
jgi:hypothetical protein